MAKRVCGFEPGGRRFESVRARHNFNELAPFRKLNCPTNHHLPHKNTHIKVVIDGWGTIVGSVCNSGWFAYRPTTLETFPQRVSTEAVWITASKFTVSTSAFCKAGGAINTILCHFIFSVFPFPAERFIKVKTMLIQHRFSICAETALRKTSNFVG